MTVVGLRFVVWVVSRGRGLRSCYEQRRVDASECTSVDLKLGLINRLSRRQYNNNNAR